MKTNLKSIQFIFRKIRSPVEQHVHVVANDLHLFVFLCSNIIPGLAHEIILSLSATGNSREGVSGLVSARSSS